MRRLLLLRHAKAERSPPGGRDHDRVLARARTRRRQEARRLSGAARLDSRTAPWFRPRRAPAKPGSCSPRHSPRRRRQASRTRLYDASPLSVLQAIRETAPKTGTLLVIGHNPGLHELAVDAGRLRRHRRARAARRGIPDLGAGGDQLCGRRLERRAYPRRPAGAFRHAGVARDGERTRRAAARSAEWHRDGSGPAGCDGNSCRADSANTTKKAATIADAAH